MAVNGFCSIFIFQSKHAEKSFISSRGKNREHPKFIFTFLSVKTNTTYCLLGIVEEGYCVGLFRKVRNK